MKKEKSLLQRNENDRNIYMTIIVLWVPLDNWDEMKVRKREREKAEIRSNKMRWK